MQAVDLHPHDWLSALAFELKCVLLILVQTPFVGFKRYRLLQDMFKNINELALDEKWLLKVRVFQDPDLSKRCSRPYLGFGS